MICEDDTTRPSAVDITAARMAMPSKAASQFGESSMNSSKSAWLLVSPG